MWALTRPQDVILRFQHRASRLPPTQRRPVVVVVVHVVVVVTNRSLLASLPLISSADRLRRVLPTGHPQALNNNGRFRVMTLVSCELPSVPLLHDLVSPSPARLKGLWQGLNLALRLENRPCQLRKRLCDVRQLKRGASSFQIALKASSLRWFTSRGQIPRLTSTPLDVLCCTASNKIYNSCDFGKHGSSRVLWTIVARLHNRVLRTTAHSWKVHSQASICLCSLHVSGD